MVLSQCSWCDKPLQRFLSVLKTGAPQYCNKVCSSAWKSRNNVELACPICAKKFKIKPSRAEQNNAMTCGSRECIGEIRRRQQLTFRGIKPEDRTVKCSQCGKEITRKPSHINRPEKSYCSVACKAKGQGGEHLEWQTRKQYPCETCGTLVWRSPATLQPHTFCKRSCRPRIEKICACGKAFSVIESQGDATFCSKTCKWDSFAAPWMGENNPLWRDGSSRLPYTEGFTPALKKRILQRDGAKCYICGTKSIKNQPKTLLAIHHIDEKKNNHDPSNLVTLCTSCHARLHHRVIQLHPR